MRRTRRAALLAAAALVGGAGMASEVLCFSGAGLAMGYGRAGAVALAAWIAAWALGAWCAGRWPVPLRRGLLGAGLACALAPPVALAALLGVAHLPLADGPAVVLAALAVALAALPQGLFLPWMARAWDVQRGAARDVAGLWAANLAGGVLGARPIGFDLAGAAGRPVAAWAAGALALAGGALAAWAAGRGRAATPPSSASSTEVPPGGGGAEASGSRALGPHAAGVAAGLGTAWLAGVEWTGFRLGALWLGGMQQAVTAVLVASLVALALGAAVLPALLPRDARGPAGCVLLALVGVAWLVAGPGPGLLDAPRARPVPAMLLLLGPAVAPLGALVPCLYRCVGGEGGARLGTILLHEAWGGLAGGPLARWLGVPSLGLAGTVGALCLAGAGILVALGRALPRPLALVALPLTLGAAVAIGLRPPPALASPALSRPAFRVVAFREDADFAVTVVDDGVAGERTLLTDDFRATGVGDDYLYMRVLGHLPLLLHPAPRRVAVLAFGTGTTAGAVGLHPEVERIDVLEISRAVIDFAPHFEEVNRGVLRRAGVRVHHGDGRRTLARMVGQLDVLTMEPLLPDSPFAVYLYTREFYARARATLAPGGLVCQWVPPHALAPRTFEGVVDAFARAFPWSGVFLFGTQVILLGGEAEPTLSPERFPAPGAPAHEALAALGLARPAGLAARFVTSGSGWPRAERPLTDADPWVVYRPRPSGLAVLALLPENLATLRAREEPLPLAWLVAAGPDASERLGAVRTLHRAREAWRRWDLARRGGPTPAEDLRGHEEYRAALAGTPFEDDPEVQQFDRQVRFDALRTGGVAALGRGEVPSALALLVEAASLRPERADVHLFVAAAAHRAGEAGVARAAGRRALRLCPRLLETPQGRVAAQLGLPPDLELP